MLALPSQTPGLLEMMGVTRREADREAWAIDRAGRRWGGAAAINRVCAELGGAWRVLAWLYRFRPIAALEDRVYGWIAANRGWLSRFYSTTPECEQPGVSCDDGGRTAAGRR